jgi:hypothetical protein
MTRAVARPQQVYQLAGLTASAPKPITNGHFILKTGHVADHVAWEWPRELKELPSILNKLRDSLRLDLQFAAARWRPLGQAE